jgi:hypothetical protein
MLWLQENSGDFGISTNEYRPFGPIPYSAPTQALLLLPIRCDRFAPIGFLLKTGLKLCVIMV